MLTSTLCGRNILAAEVKNESQTEVRIYGITQPEPRGKGHTERRYLIIPSIKDKLEMAEAFLESAVLLEQSLYRTVLDDSKEEIEARKDKQRYQRKKACHFLYAIIFELTIKIIWELEKGEECEHKHHIFKFYKQLSCESR